MLSQILRNCQQVIFREHPSLYRGTHLETSCLGRAVGLHPSQFHCEGLVLATNWKPREYIIFFCLFANLEIETREDTKIWHGRRAKTIETDWRRLPRRAENRVVACSREEKLKRNHAPSYRIGGQCDGEAFRARQTNYYYQGKCVTLMMESGGRGVYMTVNCGSTFHIHYK